METMYERIKRMTEEEMRQFIYWVYLNGNRDGWTECCDSESSYFGGYMLTLPANEVIPNGDVDSLMDTI